MKELAFLLRVFFGAVLRAFFPAVFDEARKSIRDTAEDVKPQPELKSRLQRRVRAKWKQRALAGGAALAVAFCLAGCGTRVLFVPDGEPVRLREPIPEAKVWVMSADGTPTASVCRLEAGWYVLSDPGENEPGKAPPVEAPPADPFGITLPADIPAVPAVPAPVPLPLPPRS